MPAFTTRTNSQNPRAAGGAITLTADSREQSLRSHTPANLKPPSLSSLSLSLSRALLGLAFLDGPEQRAVLVGLGLLGLRNARGGRSEWRVVSGGRVDTCKGTWPTTPLA